MCTSKHTPIGVWCCMPVISAEESLWLQGHHVLHIESHVSQAYILDPVPQTQKQNNNMPSHLFNHNGILRNPGSRCHLLCAVGWSVERDPFPGSYGSIWPLRFLQGSDCSNIRKKLVVVCLDTYLFAYLLSIYIFSFWWVRVLMCSRVWPWTCYVAKVEPSWFSYLSFLDVAITGVCGCATCMWVDGHTCSYTHMQRPDRTSVSSTMTFSFIALRQGLLLIR